MQHHAVVRTFLLAQNSEGSVSEELYLPVLHDGIDVGVCDGGILTAEHLIRAESQRVEQLLLPQLYESTQRHEERSRQNTNDKHG